MMSILGEYLAYFLFIKVRGKKRDFAFGKKNKWSTVSRHPPFAQIYAKTDAKIRLIFELPNF